MPVPVYYVGAAADMEHHARPLADAFDLRIVTHEEVVRHAGPGDVCVFYNEYFPHFREACLQLNKQQCGTLYAIDGILEWRNSWELPDTGACCLWVMRPVLSHKVACVGRSQARVLESWGNRGKCELVGVPRFDCLAGRQPRRRHDGEPFRVLVLTAKCPGFDQEQMSRTRQSLLDLKAWFDAHPIIGGVAIQAVWRLTYGLEETIGVDNRLNDTTGLDLAAALESVDATVTTPSTAMLEGMLQGLPVALLDYHNRPHYVPSAWRITAAEQFDQVMPELLAPSPARMVYQESILHDALECRSPATPRFIQLVAEMHQIAQGCLARGERLIFPERILIDEQDAPQPVEKTFDHARLYPQQPHFGVSDPGLLQAEEFLIPDSSKRRRPIIATRSRVWKHNVLSCTILLKSGSERWMTTLCAGSMCLRRIPQTGGVSLSWPLRVCSRSSMRPAMH